MTLQRLTRGKRDLSLEQRSNPWLPSFCGETIIAHRSPIAYLSCIQMLRQACPTNDNESLRRTVRHPYHPLFLGPKTEFVSPFTPQNPISRDATLLGFEPVLEIQIIGLQIRVVAGMISSAETSSGARCLYTCTSTILRTRGLRRLFRSTSVGIRL